MELIELRREDSPDEKKKFKHKKIEQKRRDGIKAKMAALRNAIPHSTNDTQATVLDKAVEHIHYQKAQYQELLARAVALHEDYLRIGGRNRYLPDDLLSQFAEPKPNSPPRSPDLDLRSPRQDETHLLPEESMLPEPVEDSPPSSPRIRK